MTRRDWSDVGALLWTVVLCLSVLGCWAVGLPWLARLALWGVR